MNYDGAIMNYSAQKLLDDGNMYLSLISGWNKKFLLLFFSEDGSKVRTHKVKTFSIS